MVPARRRLFSDEQTPNPDLPPLANIPSLSQEEKLALLIEPTGITFPLDILPKEWRLYFLALAYWANHAKQPSVTDKHVHAAILGVILLALVRPCKKENKEFALDLSSTSQKALADMPDVKTALENVKSTDCKILYSLMYIPHSQAESRNHKANYDLSIVHSFAQLQSTLLCLMQLNQLLGMPLETMPLHRLFSGELCQYKIGI